MTQNYIIKLKINMGRNEEDWIDSVACICSNIIANQFSLFEGGSLEPICLDSTYTVARSWKKMLVSDLPVEFVVKDADSGVRVELLPGVISVHPLDESTDAIDITPYLMLALKISENFLIYEVKMGQ